VIASGREVDVIPRVASGDNLGTLLTTDREPQSARKQWLASLMHPKGRLVLDEGAVSKIAREGRSLLPIGVTDVSGQFVRGDLVSCVDAQGREVARGLVNYGAEDARKLVRTSSGDIEAKVGYGGDPEMIHRDNMVSV